MAPVDYEEQQAEAEEQKYTKVTFIYRMPFNIFVAATTLLYIVCLGLEEDLSSGDNDDTGDRVQWFLLDIVFMSCFGVELIARICCDGKYFFGDIWNIADIILVCAAVFDTVFLAPAGIGGFLRYFLVLRALRIVGVIRLVRMYPAVRELWLLVGGLSNSIKALGWVGAIVLLLLYVCSIVVTTEIGQNVETYGTGPSYDGTVWPYDKYFGTVWRSVFTLFQVLTLDNWCDNVVRHVVYRQPLMGIFFIMFLLFTAFGLMNVVIGIIVENTLAAAQVADRRVEERESAMRKAGVAQLQDILEKSDKNRTGGISMEELRAAYTSRIVKDTFDQIGVTFEQAQEIFRLLDYEGLGRVELKRFAGSCKELVGGAKRRDIAQVEVTVGTLAQQLGKLDSQVKQIEEQVSGLNLMANHFVDNTARLLTGYNGKKVQPPLA
jgi:voltage-gated sodium channel